MDDILIQYQGFHPSDFTRSYLDSKLSEIYSQAPYGASIRAVFTRKNKVLSAHLRIMSAAGQFFISAQGQHLNDVGQKLAKRVRKQLKRWQTMRLKRQRLRDLKADPHTLRVENHDPDVA
jgi:hypothetical protein